MPRRDIFVFHERMAPEDASSLLEAWQCQNAKGYPLPFLIRALSGSVKVEHVPTGTITTPSKNYLVPSMRLSKKAWKKRACAAIGEEVTEEALENFLLYSRHRNVRFWQGILDEFCFFTMQNKRNNSVSAFVHLYRIVENVAFCFPLLYSSHSEDFAQSFNQMKNLFSGDGDKGEIAAFQFFLKNTMRDSALLESDVDFSMQTDDQDIGKAIYNRIKESCNNITSLSYDEDSGKLTVEFKEIVGLIYSIRNRFFHNATGMKNLKSAEIHDPEILFRTVNDTMMYCISIILCRVLNRMVEEFDAMAQRLQTTSRALQTA